MEDQIELIKKHLEIAFAIAQNLQSEIQRVEGDSDLHRKFEYYLTPALNHWINGVQAGNMKDIAELLNRRNSEPKKNTNEAGAQGDGQEVLTAPKK